MFTITDGSGVVFPKETRVFYLHHSVQTYPEAQPMGFRACFPGCIAARP
jgi:hypothetical protein